MFVLFSKALLQLGVLRSETGLEVLLKFRLVRSIILENYIRWPVELFGEKNDRSILKNIRGSA